MAPMRVAATRDDGTDEGGSDSDDDDWHDEVLAAECFLEPENAVHRRH